MGKCIVHVGMHKTGSTSIQASLNRFESSRFLYANFDRSPNHSVALYNLFSPTPGGRRHARIDLMSSGLSREAYNASKRSALASSIASAGDRTFLISGEDIGRIASSGLARLSDYLRAYFDEITIVGYARPPASYMASLYLHRSRRLLMPPSRMGTTYPRYREFFGKFDTVFGREHVHVWKFDPGVFPQGCVVRDFCSRLQIDLPPERIVRRNESFSKQAVCLLYTYRKFAGEIGGKPFRPAAVRRLAALGKARLRISPDLLRPVLDANRADIEWMEERCGQSLCENLGEHQPGDIREESDLLEPDPATTRALLALLGDRAPKGVRGTTPREVALLVKALCADTPGN
jgi:hypothetical protein